jgi:hypothetical protein
MPKEQTFVYLVMERDADPYAGFWPEGIFTTIVKVREFLSEKGSAQVCDENPLDDFKVFKVALDSKFSAMRNIMNEEIIIN